ncbi:hypothetical protein [Modicisalibacter sp. MOD 31.J]|uniref:hypothetical protein n=1 Tax=Modicisalibacter sp. MOD 31.J TaxID=2831897 RepID=UPI001CCFBADB|nr:hypothetical protein [Modicisalibacter sp. MOD 31.J]MBZ9574427.1 hypothetical protein [Modicisalibacter sp. MOD 31.J]
MSYTTSDDIIESTIAALFDWDNPRTQQSAEASLDRWLQRGGLTGQQIESVEAALDKYRNR